jgi:pyrroline-5-carboxylate reductase
VERKKEQGYFASQQNMDVCQCDNDAIVICVKPNYVTEVCRDIVAAENDAVVISVAAGITLKTLEEHLPNRRVVRVMPNTACLVGESASGFSLGTLATAEDKATVETIFGSVGIALEQKEDLLNAVTGLSGSGPAYVFQFIEALADGQLSLAYLGSF